MEENNANAPVRDDDEISLVDIFVVLLKYRRLIIVSTIVALALAVVAYLIYPPYSLAKAEERRKVEVTTSLIIDSGLEAIFRGNEGLNFITQSLFDTSNIANALRGAGCEPFEDLTIGAGADEDKAFYEIRRLFVENTASNGTKLKESDRVYSVTVDKGVVSVTYKSSDADSAKAFLSGMIDIVRQELYGFSRPKAVSTIESYELLLTMPNPVEAVKTSIVAQGYRDYSAAKAFLDGANKPLTVLREPYVLVPIVSAGAIRADLLKTCVLMVFGVFFLAVFGAFALNYVDTVKRDPEAMGKIRSALDKG